MAAARRRFRMNVALDKTRDSFQNLFEFRTLQPVCSWQWAIFAADSWWYPIVSLVSIVLLLFVFRDHVAANVLRLTLPLLGLPPELTRMDRSVWRVRGLVGVPMEFALSGGVMPLFESRTQPCALAGVGDTV